jgi:hypothetical protein
MMKEEFLHYLWKYGLFYKDKLVDQEGNRIVVINPGQYNRDGGPDFFNARIVIGETEWAGNIEIHSDSSHWDIHGHNNDHKYDNVILHLVVKNSKAVYTASGNMVTTAEVIFDESMFEKYTGYLNKPYIIACEDELGSINKIFLHQWITSLLVERLEEKSKAINEILIRTEYDWEETLYRIIARYFGFRVNTEPFEMLASALPQKIIKKHADNRFQIEALLFGVAGMLDEGLFREAIGDAYYRDLVKEFKILSVKYSLAPMHGWLWNFHRLRPSNFPTLRISQMASFLASSNGLFSRIIETDDIEKLKGIFRVTSSDYWNNHFIFGKKSSSHAKNTGDQALDILLINAIIPVIYTFGKTREDHIYKEKAVNLLDNISPETNSIIKEWKSAGVEVPSAFFSQALIRLRNEYCKKRLCLNCRIGCKLISQGRKLRLSDEMLLEP